MLIEFKAIAASFEAAYGDSDFAIETEIEPNEPLSQPDNFFWLIYQVSTESSMTLKSGSNLSKRDGTIQLTGNADWKEGQRNIGIMHNEYTSYRINVGLPKSMFDKLYGSAILGNLPSVISIGIRHSEHLSTNGWDDEDTFLEVISIEFNGQIAGAK